MSFGKILFCFCFVLHLFSIQTVHAQKDSLSINENKELLIGVYAQPPYVIPGEDGTWDGLSIRLWRGVADTLNLTYRFAEVEPSKPAVELLQSGFDVLLLGDVTSRAEEQIDFSHIYNTSELGVATSSTMSLSRLAGAFFNKRFWKIALALSVLLLIVGTIIYLVERNSNEDNFGGDRSIARGIGSGFWWAGVTMTTIGYGDKAPVTFVGRALALIWMLIAMAVTAVLTASLVSVVMASSGNKDVKAPGDLRDMKIAAIEGSAAADYLEAERVPFKTFTQVSEALKAVNKKEYEAVLHSVPALRYNINNDPDLSLRVQSLKLDPQYYAFAVTARSPLRKQINIGLLRILNTAIWQQELDRFIPEKKK